MERIGRFEKVSLKRFEEDFLAAGLSDCELPAAEAAKGAETSVTDVEKAAADGPALEEIYASIELPVRATSGSAGYDFHTPCGFTLKPGQSIKIVTGIRVYIAPGWMLLIAPRSGLGNRYRVQLNNTIGIIDSDYYYSDNEGHIQMTITNDSKEGKTLELKAGDRFVQGIFVPYGITEDDHAAGVRNGGFGSTK